MPGLRTGKRGDLVVVVQLVVPSRLNDEQRELLGEYAKLEDLDVGNGSGRSFWEKIKGAVTGG